MKQLTALPMPDVLQGELDTIQTHVANKAVSPGHGFELCSVHVNMQYNVSMTM